MKKIKINMVEFEQFRLTCRLDAHPEILSVKQFATMLGKKLSSVYEWIKKGRFGQAVIKGRGRSTSIMRDLGAYLFFHGPQWTKKVE